MSGDQFVAGEIAWNVVGNVVQPGPRFTADRIHQLWITPHGAIKAALIQYTRTQAAAFAKKRIRVNCVAPGWVDTALMRFTELFQAIPGFAFAVVLVAIFQPSVQSVVAAIAIAVIMYWIPMILWSVLKM